MLYIARFKVGVYRDGYTVLPAAFLSVADARILKKIYRYCDAEEALIRLEEEFTRLWPAIYKVGEEKNGEGRWIHCVAVHSRPFTAVILDQKSGTLHFIQARSLRGRTYRHPYPPHKTP